MLSAVIRVAILDDHPAVLAGLQRLIERTDDLVPVAAVDTAEVLWREIDKTRPDVVILDYDLSRGDGLSLCQRLKERVRPPAVAIYSAYAGPALEIAARLAGADALIDKRAPAADLVIAVRRIAAGDAMLPDVPVDLRVAAMTRLDPDDVPVAAMLLAGTSHQGIAQALGIDRRDVVRRLRRIIGRLRPNGGLGNGRTVHRPDSAIVR